MFATIVGSSAAFLTTVCQVPQLVKILKRKHTKDISFETYTILGIGVFLWVAYGLFIHDVIIIIANVVTFLIVLWIWLLKVRYG